MGAASLIRCAVAGIALALSAAPLAAQFPDSLAADSIRADSLRADSLLRRQSMQTERFLEALQSGRVRTPSIPSPGAGGPRGDGARIVLTEDSVHWTMAQTVGDLIAYVPGAYLWRTGWVGAAELPNFRGRGATSVEYYLDGIPYVAVGLDSITVDPSTMALSLFERIEIEPWPALLRVYLFSRRHERIAARSLIGLSRGTDDLTGFEAQLEKRGLRGIGFGLAADYYNSGSPSGTTGDLYRNTQFWVQASYLPNPRRGVLVQWVRTGPSREDIASTTGSGGATGLDGSRSDLMLRAFARQGDNGLGPLAALTVTHTSFSSDSLDVSQAVTVITASLGYRTATLGTNASAAWRSRWTPLDVRLDGGWSPAAGIALNADGGVQLHSASRTSAWIGAQGSARLARRFVLRGSVRTGSIVAAPSIESETAQSIFDGSASAAFETGLFAAELGITHTASFRSLAYTPLVSVVASIPETPATNWFTAKARLTPFNWLAIDAWYSTPSGDVPAGQPGDHALAVGSIRSKFLRQFPSGAFDLKASLGLERWGQGVLGLDPAGGAVVLPSQLYLQTTIQMQIQSFTAFFTRSNLLGELPGYVPGFPITSRTTMFGVRWGFWN